MLQNTEKNRTFSTQNTKIRTRSLAISYIYMFSVKYCKKKRRKKRPCYQLPRKNWWLPCPRPPDKGSNMRNFNGRNYSFYHSWRPSWRPLFAENSRASGGIAPCAPAGALPLHPARGPTTAPVDPTRMGRFAHAWCATRTGIFRPPFLELLDPPLHKCVVSPPPPAHQLFLDLRDFRWWRSGKKSVGAPPPPPPPRSSAFLGGPKKTVCCAPPPLFFKILDPPLTKGIHTCILGRHKHTHTHTHTHIYMGHAFSDKCIVLSPASLRVVCWKMYGNFTLFCSVCDDLHSC